ncbi:Uncharacterised protein [uncultured archaeon]|nr:Uncharacterised protein [uncultured archaeon]
MYDQDKIVGFLELDTGEVCLDIDVRARIP